MGSVVFEEKLFMGIVKLNGIYGDKVDRFDGV